MSSESLSSAIEEVTASLKTEHEAEVVSVKMYCSEAQEDAVRDALANLEKKHAISMEESERLAIEVKDAAVEAAATEIATEYSTKLALAAKSNEKAIAETLEKAKVDADVCLESALIAAKNVAEEEKVMALEEASIAASDAHMKDLNLAREEADEALQRVRDKLESVELEAMTAKESMKDEITEEKALRSAAEALIEENKTSLEEFKIKEAHKIAELATSQMNIAASEAKIIALKEELGGVRESWRKEKEEEENADEPTLYRKVALMEKEMEQVHKDAAALAERGGKLERRCHEAETKARDAEKRLHAAESKMMQYQMDMESKQGVEGKGDQFRVQAQVRSSERDIFFATEAPRLSSLFTLPFVPPLDAEPLPLNLVFPDSFIGDGVALSRSIECFLCIDGLMA
eukprot:g1830.t1